MRLTEFTNEAMDPGHKAAIKGMHQLSGDQYYGLYKTMNDVAGHDGKKQTAPNGNSDDEVSDKPFAYAYTDEEEAMIKGADPKAKKITSSDSEELDESQLDEIDRRGFLKGLGAAAVAGAAGYKMGQDSTNGKIGNGINVPSKVPNDPTIFYLTSYIWHIAAAGHNRSQVLSNWWKNVDPIFDQVQMNLKLADEPQPWQRLNAAVEKGERDAKQQNLLWSKIENGNDAEIVNGLIKSTTPKYNQLKQLLGGTKESVNQGVAEAGIPFRGTAGAFNRGDDERHDLDVPRPTIYALKINGKIWQKDGNVVTFFTRERALAARNSILAKRPELEVGLVQRQD